MKYFFLIILLFLVNLFIGANVNAQECAKVIGVSTLATQPIALNTPFTCIVTVDNPTTEQKKNIACGISINGGFPKNYCPSHNSDGHNFFGGWQGNQGYFGCAIPNTDEIINATSLELVGDDFSSENCKKSTRIAIPLAIQKNVVPTGSGGNSAQGQKISDDAVNFVANLLRTFQALSGSTSDSQGTSSSPPTDTSNVSLTRAKPTASREQEAIGKLQICGITSRTPIDGPPTISVAKMQEVLRSYNSPTVGDAQAFYDLGVKYNINPAVMLIFFIHESSAGTAGVSVQTKNIGNIVCTAGYSCTSGRDHSFRRYNTWVEGAEDYYRLLRELYLNKWGLYYVETILPIYAPLYENPTLCSRIQNSVDKINSWK